MFLYQQYEAVLSEAKRQHLRPVTVNEGRRDVMRYTQVCWTTLT
jgi:hypothetical protein